MGSTAAISVVMPVRHAASTLAAALESIRSQTCQDWQLVTVDDGSTDNGHEILAAAAREDPRIHCLRQERLGIVAALSAGCRAARGEFIARMDADDWMSPERLERQLDLLQGHPSIGVVSCLVRHGGSGTAQAGYADHVAWINSLVTPEQIALRRFVESPVAHPSVMFRRRLLSEHGGYREGLFPEDYELWLRWMDAGVCFGKVTEELLVWNDRPERLSRTEPRYAIEHFYEIKCQFLARWLKQNVEPARAIWLWGAGRVTRQRFQLLEAEGVVIRGYIDVDFKKWGHMRDGRPVVGPDDLPPNSQAFIIAGVGSRGARELIGQELERRGRMEGRDYLLAA